MSPSRIPASTIESRSRAGGSRVASERLGDGDLVLDRLLGGAGHQQRSADERQRGNRRRSTGASSPFRADESIATWLRRIVVQKPARRGSQGGACTVEGEARRRLADLPNGGRIAVRVHVLSEELPDSCCRVVSIGVSRGRGTNVCSPRRVEILPDDVKRSDAARRTPPARARTGSRRSCPRARGPTRR